jgi:4-hydroxyphenylpyruvate dioxygenase
MVCLLPPVTLNILGIHHLTFFVEEVAWWQQWFVEKLGFVPVAQGYLQSGRVMLCIAHDPSYLQHHPAGLGELCFQVASLEPLAHMGLECHAVGEDVLCVGPGGLRHRFTCTTPLSAVPGFGGIDHLVFNVGRGDLAQTSAWYETYLGWSVTERFTIVGKFSSLYSCVLRNAQGTVQLALNEPTSPNSQIQEFLDHNRGWGIQHVALTSTQLTQDVARFRAQGIKFLAPPPDYYDHIEISADLREAGILVDRHPQQPEQCLLQIFTQPIFPEPTFFWEFIQRIGGRQGFGEGNFQALFQAVEAQQAQRNVK